MGRKAKAKEKVRRLIEQKSLTEEKGFLAMLKKTKSKKEIKKEVIKQRKTTKAKIAKKENLAKKKPSRLKKHRTKILGGTLALIMFTLLVSTGFLLFQKAFRPDPIANYLPMDNTIFTLEINSNPDHSQLTKAFNLLKNHEDYSKEGVIKMIEDKYLVNFANDLEPWWGRNIGMAIISSQRKEGEINVISFAEVARDTALNEFMAKTESSTYLGYPIYTTANSITVTKISDYLFFSDEEKSVQELIDFRHSSGEALSGSDRYQKIKNNMPINKVAFAYINFANITDGLFQYYPYLSEKGLSKESIAPFLTLFESEGLALVALNDKFAIQSFINLTQENTDEESLFGVKEKYTASLADYVPDDLLVFWGGENAEYQIKRLLSVLSGEKSSVVSSMFLNYSNSYFGKETSIENDVLPLLKEEYAIALEMDNNRPSYKLLVQLVDMEKDAQKINNMIKDFVTISAFYKPEVVEHVMEDKSVYKEIIAVPEEIEEIELEYKGYKILHMKIGEREWGIYSTEVLGVAIISTSLDGIKSSIDAKNEGKSLKISDSFSKIIEPVLSSSDEVSYFNLEGLLPVLMNDVPAILDPIESISSGKNYFNDGITSINYLYTK